MIYIIVICHRAEARRGVKGLFGTRNGRSVLNGTMRLYTKRGTSTHRTHAQCNTTPAASAPSPSATTNTFELQVLRMPHVKPTSTGSTSGPVVVATSTAHRLAAPTRSTNRVGGPLAATRARSLSRPGVCLHPPAPDIMLAEVQMVQPPLYLPAPPCTSLHRPCTSASIISCTFCTPHLRKFRTFSILGRRETIS